MKTVTYNLDHETFEKYDRDDPFVSRILQSQIINGSVFRKCCNYLSKSNFFSFLGIMASIIASRWENELIDSQPYFNDLGGIRLGLDVRKMITCLGDLYYTSKEKQELFEMGITDDETIDEADFTDVVESGALNLSRNRRLNNDQFLRSIRGHFSRLSQIAFLLELDKTNHVQVLSYAATPVLSEKDVRSILRRRIPLHVDDIPIDELDVSRHVCGSKHEDRIFM